MSQPFSLLFLCVFTVFTPELCDILVASYRWKCLSLALIFKDTFHSRGRIISLQMLLPDALKSLTCRRYMLTRVGCCGYSCKSLLKRKNKAVGAESKSLESLKIIWNYCWKIHIYLMQLSLTVSRAKFGNNYSAQFSPGQTSALIQSVPFQAHSFFYMSSRCCKSPSSSSPLNLMKSLLHYV